MGTMTNFRAEDMPGKGKPSTDKKADAKPVEVEETKVAESSNEDTEVKSSNEDKADKKTTTKKTAKKSDK